ncbi:MAG: serine hydrolase domain-containing protein [Chloroflexota bacterium]
MGAEQEVPAERLRSEVPIDPAELGDFADTFFTSQMDALHIPGAVFVFVQGDEVIYARGYGYASLEQQIPMEAANTVVRIGSISKSLVATAVMQLVEQGRLDLQCDFCSRQPIEVLQCRRLAKIAFDFPPEQG